MPFLKKERDPLITIQSAIAKRLISFNLVGEGGGDTSKVHLTIKNLSNEPLNIQIPRGTRFSPKEGGS